MIKPALTDLLTKGARTRQRIVEEALFLFAQHGVDTTSLKDIAARVGVSEPAIYRHFPSKGELVWQIFSEAYTALALRLEEAQQGSPTLRGKLERIIEIYCDLHDANQTLFRFLFITQHGQLVRVTSDMANPVEVVLRVISAGIEAGEIPSQDPQLLTALLFGLVTQPAVFLIYGRLNGKLSRFKRKLSSAAWAAITCAG